MPKSSKPSTHDKSSDLSFGERTQETKRDGTSQRLMMSEVNVENLSKSSSMSLNDPPRGNVNINPRSTTYRSVLIDEPPNPACVDERVFVNNTSDKPRASIFSRLQRDEHMSRGEDRENKRRSNAEPDHLAKRLSKETLANACPSLTKNRVSSIKVTYNPWNENM